MKYIDAEKLRSVLQNTINSMKEKDAKGERYDAFLNGKLSICEELLGCIDSLQQEQPEVDLEKEMDSYFNEHFSPCVDGTLISERTGMEIDGNDYDDIARHFYELGLNARKEEGK